MLYRVDNSLLYNNQFRLVTNQEKHYCYHFKINNNSYSLNNGNSLSCWLKSPHRSHSYQQRQIYLKEIRNFKSSSLTSSYYNNQPIIVNSNCPLLYYWLCNNKTTELFVKRKLLSSDLQNEHPVDKTRYIIQKVTREYFKVNKDVIEMKNNMLKKLVAYYTNNISNITIITTSTFNQYIALHIRMGFPYSDFPEKYTYLNKEDLKVVVSYINTLDHSLPIFLATDSHFARNYFTDIFRNRVITFNGSIEYTTDKEMMKKLNNNNNSSYYDKMVMSDILVLSQSSFLIGTYESTFSTIASWMGQAKTVYVRKNDKKICYDCYTVHDR